jgi:hypothetical protein
LDRVVDVADGDFVFDFVVKDRLEGAYYLVIKHVRYLTICLGAKSALWRVVNVSERCPGLLTTTPPISKRMAFGGLDGEDMTTEGIGSVQLLSRNITAVCRAPLCSASSRSCEGQGTSAMDKLH